MNQNVSDEISSMKILPLTKSNYMKPMRAEFTINQRQKYWDFLKVHDSVAILIYNTTREVVVLVRQFRPSMYIAQATDVQEGSVIDPNNHPLVQGYSLELCAGIVDKDNTIEQIAKEEVMEECGYDIPVSSLKHVFSSRSVGITGEKLSVFYVEVTDEQKVSAGGGLKEEGEFIEIIELTIPELKNYINSKTILSPSTFVAAVQWFLCKMTHSVQ